MINKVKTLTRSECQDIMAAWIDSKGENAPYVDSDYVAIREAIIKMYHDAEGSWKLAYGRHDYYVDVIFGLKLYDYLNSQEWFNLRVAANTDFWRYLSVSVWKRPMRIWLKSLWWYVHFSWCGSLEETEILLLKPMFSTDTILNLVERSGKNGTNIDLYRDIIKTYSCLGADVIERFKNRGLKETDLFRAIMKLNTAKIIVTEPSLCMGGVHGYIALLCKDLNVKI